MHVPLKGKRRHNSEQVEVHPHLHSGGRYDIATMIGLKGRAHTPIYDMIRSVLWLWSNMRVPSHNAGFDLIEIHTCKHDMVFSMRRLQT